MCRTRALGFLLLPDYVKQNYFFITRLRVTHPARLFQLINKKTDDNSALSYDGQSALFT